MDGELLYLDSSALAKLVVDEPETQALRLAIRAWPQRVSSVVAAVEVARAARRLGKPETAARAETVLRRVELLDLDHMIVRLATTLEPSTLGSLDAVHVATALALGPSVGAFACYHGRLQAAATSAGLTVLAPV